MGKKTQQEKDLMVFNQEGHRIAKNMPVLPGSPDDKMMNHPGNVTSLGSQSASLSDKGASRHPYQDTGAVYAQMGADVLNPMNQPHSGLQQSFVRAGRGHNATPYNMQPQPNVAGNSPLPEGMEGYRLGGLRDTALPTHPNMGMIGTGPTQGAMPPDMPGTNGPQLMPGYGAIPGATPQKKGQPRQHRGKK